MRLDKLDILRALAIILMIIFHINYSLINIFNIEILNFSESFWFIEGKISAFLFIFIAGFSFFLAEKKYKNKIVKKYLKISLFLGFIAGGISLSTYLFMPEQYIRFGIIHFFALAFFLLIFFRKLRYLNLILGIGMIIYGFYFIPTISNEFLYFLGFTYSSFTSADFYPIFPYFGIMLLGYTTGMYLNKINKLSLLHTQNNNTFFYIVGKNISKRSLLIYLIHQPIIIGVIWLVV